MYFVIIQVYNSGVFNGWANQYWQIEIFLYYEYAFTRCYKRN